MDTDALAHGQGHTYRQSGEESHQQRRAFAELILETPQGTKRENLTVALVIFRLIMGAGLRKGEVLGLRWKHVTLGKEAQIRVRETYVMSAADEPKSEASKRTIDIGPRLANALSAHREWSAYAGEDERVACNPRLAPPEAEAHPAARTEQEEEGEES